MSETKAVYRVTPDGDALPDAPRAPQVPALYEAAYWQAQAETAIRLSEALGAERDAAQAEVQRLRTLLAQTIEALESSIQQVERLLAP